MAGNGLGSNPAGPPDGPPRPPDSSPAGPLDGPPGPLDGPTGPLDGPTGPPDALPPGYDQWAAVCGKHYGDAISAALCAGNQPPRITSIAELEQRLGMNRNNSTLSITGLSTGMGLHMVTPFNPNAILAKSIFPARYMVLAFARGEPLVELVANDSQTLHFFAIRFHPACEATGCNSADLLTPTIESNWTGYELFDDEALANTTLDCNTCHQPNGPGTPKILRMQERFSPWTHWFSRLSDSEFLFLFYRSHDLESTYAGVEINLGTTDPGALQFVLEDNGFVPQPNEFVSQKISDELRANGTSATWQALYANAVAGNAIPPPYFGVNQTDPNKAAAMLDAYRAVMAGTLPRDQLPDIRDVFDESALSAMSIRPKPGLDGRGILVHICSQCHNSRLDQTLTRARFNVMALDAMSRQERDTAITRLQLADSDPAKMPPPRFRSLSDAERALVITELSK